MVLPFLHDEAVPPFLDYLCVPLRRQWSHIPGERSNQQVVDSFCYPSGPMDIQLFPGGLHRRG